MAEQRNRSPRQPHMQGGGRAAFNGSTLLPLALGVVRIVVPRLLINAFAIKCCLGCFGLRAFWRGKLAKFAAMSACAGIIGSDGVIEVQVVKTKWVNDEPRECIGSMHTSNDYMVRSNREEATPLIETAFQRQLTEEQLLHERDQLAMAKESGRRLGIGTNMYPSSSFLGRHKDASIVDT
ncbi:hypothetical protein Tco_0247130 [Tanacetum coccineum]